ncbi:MAG: hypothetical protein ACR2PX_24570 [Endozoicomonas sp.]|uniref:hypothetical protein n=1 Tax=Endozoicomonas sp. TaxID=1892382 RepID=UPI003D9AC575
MKVSFVRSTLYTDLDPMDFWVEIVNDSIYRSSRSKTHPNIKKIRPIDVKSAVDPFVPKNKIIIPCSDKGVSFADSPATLRRKGFFRGQWIWEASPGPLPEGLVINYQNKTHPLLNVCRVMTEEEFLEKINTMIKKGRLFQIDQKV